jgi:hypothetical protein
VFSLAVVCYEALTCRRLFARESQYETYNAIVNGTIPELTSARGDVPSAVSRAVLGGLARTLGKRHASCQAFAEALKAAASADGIASRSTIKSTMERLFGTEIESQRQRLNDARPELSMSEISIAKQPRKGEISQLPGILLDDLGDVGATLLDDLSPIDLSSPSDKKAAALEDKTPPDDGRPRPVPGSSSHARTPVPEVTPAASARQANRTEEPPEEPPSSFGLWLAIGVGAVVLGAIVLLVVWVFSHNVEIEVLDPNGAPVVIQDAGSTREEPSPAALDTALPAAVDAGAARP